LIDFEFYHHSISDSGMLICRNQHYKKWSVADYYYRNNNTFSEVLLLKQTTAYFFYFCTESKQAIFDTRTHLKLISVETGVIKWVREWSYTSILKTLGCFAGKLILLCNKEGQAYNVVIDIQTGATVLEIIGDFSSALTKNSNSIIELKGGGLWINGVGLVEGSNFFQERDVLTGKILRAGFLTQLTLLGLCIKTFTIVGEYLFFTANYQGSFGATAIGVLDYEMLHLQWWQTVEMEATDGFGNFLITPPNVTNGKLYVLDKTSVLHIYQQTPDFVATRVTESRLTIPSPPIQTIKVTEKERILDKGDELPF
jgi:hypothetical protein